MNVRPAEVIEPDVETAMPALDIGARLAQLRQQQGWTLQQASKRTGVSASALSKIERNELSPTIATLQRVAHGYELDVVALLNDREASRSLPGRRSVTRADEGRPYQSNSCANTVLCADLLDKRMTPIRTRVTARSPEEYRSWPVSDAEIFVTVIKGTMVVHSQIYEPLILNAGDSLYYDAGSPHIWTSQGPEDAEVIWVISS
ncbi:helix-turn-helix domain-containing protein [Neoaquamicrobium sediminum]|uniref:helix-turn-helix domain-containing protein n=1 Tax=Neoaquamicrobium sediminum TaxID=1849104 RepID=UPI003BAB3E66